VRCFSDSHPAQAARLAISYALHVLAPHARPSQLHSFKVVSQVITECFKSSEAFFSCVLSELTEAKVCLSKFILGSPEAFVEGLLFLQSVIACTGASKCAHSFALFADALFKVCSREIMQGNLPPVFLIHSLLQTLHLPSDADLAHLALSICKSALQTCADPDLSSDANFSLLIDCAHFIITRHCIGAMGRLDDVDALRSLIPYLLRIEMTVSGFGAAASLAAFPEHIAPSLSEHLYPAALGVLEACSFSSPQTVYQNTKAVLALSLKLWASSGQLLLSAAFQQLLDFKSSALPNNLFAVFAAFNQMTADRRVSQLLRDRAAVVEDCIEWLLETIDLQDPEDSSHLFSLSPYASPQSSRNETVESAASKLAASVRASLTFSCDDTSAEDHPHESSTFAEKATKLEPLNYRRQFE
jgi:hypothetical protein